jgi:Mobilization protein NikA
MADAEEIFDMAATSARLKALGAVQTKAVATTRAAMADSAVDRRTLRIGQGRTRTAQVNLKMLPADADLLRRKAKRAGLSVVEYVMELVREAKP